MLTKIRTAWTEWWNRPPFRLDDADRRSHGRHSA